MFVPSVTYIHSIVQMVVKNLIFGSSLDLHFECGTLRPSEINSRYLFALSHSLNFIQIINSKLLHPVCSYVMYNKSVLMYR